MQIYSYSRSFYVVKYLAIFQNVGTYYVDATQGNIE